MLLSFVLNDKKSLIYFYYLALNSGKKKDCLVATLLLYKLFTA